MIKIGITGSLASGKSTVAKMISSGNILFITLIQLLRKSIKQMFLKRKFLKNLNLKIKKI